MKVLFIITETLRKSKFKNNEFPLATQEDIHLGVAYISSMLESRGHVTDLFMLTNPEKCDDLEKFIKEFQPQVIGFSAVYREFDAIVKVADYVKNTFPDIFLFAGGAHITLNPELAIQKSFDAVCIGEGEYPVLELVEKIENHEKVSGIKNFWIKTEDGIEKNETRDYIMDLDGLPFPNRRIWQKYIKNKKGLHDIIIGRGCPFDCTYCCNHALRNVSNGCYVRFRSPDNIISEIKMLIDEYQDLDTIFLEAEAINLNPEFLEELATKLCEFNKTLKRPIVYGANIRLHANIDIPKIIKQFVKANIVIINIGLESGSERVRNDILSRSEYNNDDVRLAVKLAKKYHRHVMLFVLLGLPGETMKECRETLEMVKECRPSFIHLGIFTPYPGTILHKKCLEDGLINKDKYKERGRHLASFDTQNMTKKQIQKEYYRFFPKVYANNLREYVILRVLVYLIYRWNWTFLSKYGLKYLR